MRLCCRLWLVLMLAWPAAASAQEEEPEPPPDAAEPEQEADEPTAIEVARGHMERGQALYLQARFEEAASEFQSAYEAQPFSAFLFNAGVALERAEQTGRAADFFEQYVE